MLNGHYSSRIKVRAGVFQGSILWPLFILIYVNDLSENLASNHKLIADEISLFSLVRSTDASSIELNNSLKKISEWAYQWKTKFNLNPAKHLEIIFQKTNKIKP